MGGVIALHLGCPGSALGWTGVNLFFVLSGFLITGILLQDKGSQHYYATFYCRRSLRIFPIYYLTIATLAFAGIATGESISHLPYFATYTQNWAYALYDVHVQFPWGGSHTWSLAIEEQFYLLWPLAVAMLPEQALLKLVVLIIILGNLSRDLVMHMAFLGPDSQWGAGYAFQYDMLAWGALGAIIYRGNLLPQETLARLAKLGVVIGIATLVFVRLHYGPGVERQRTW